MNSKLICLFLAALLCYFSICVNGQSGNVATTTAASRTSAVTAPSTSAAKVTPSTHATVPAPTAATTTKPNSTASTAAHTGNTTNSQPLDVPEISIIAEIPDLLDDIIEAVCDFKKQLLPEVPIMMKVAVNSILEATKMAVVDIVSKVKTAINSVLSNSVKLTSECLGSLISLVTGIIEVIKSSLQIVLGMIKSLVKFATSLASTLMKTVGETVGEIVGALKKSYTLISNSKSITVGGKRHPLHKKFTSRHHEHVTVPFEVI